ncbi:MAG: hypothetical protein AB7P00_20345 [Sandaracinaceae bacterium]
MSPNEQDDPLRLLDEWDADPALREVARALRRVPESPSVSRPFETHPHLTSSRARWAIAAVVFAAAAAVLFVLLNRSNEDQIAGPMVQLDLSGFPTGAVRGAGSEPGRDRVCPDVDEIRSRLARAGIESRIESGGEREALRVRVSRGEDAALLHVARRVTSVQECEQGAGLLVQGASEDFESAIRGALRLAPIARLVDVDDLRRWAEHPAPLECLRDDVRRLLAAPLEGRRPLLLSPPPDSHELMTGTAIALYVADLDEEPALRAHAGRCRTVPRSDAGVPFDSVVCDIAVFENVAALAEDLAGVVAVADDPVSVRQAYEVMLAQHGETPARTSLRDACLTWRSRAPGLRDVALELITWLAAHERAHFDVPLAAPSGVVIADRCDEDSIQRAARSEVAADRAALEDLAALSYAGHLRDTLEDERVEAAFVVAQWLALAESRHWSAADGSAAGRAGAAEAHMSRMAGIEPACDLSAVMVATRAAACPCDEGERDRQRGRIVVLSELMQARGWQVQLSEQPLEHAPGLLHPLSTWLGIARNDVLALMVGTYECTDVPRLDDCWGDEAMMQLAGSGRLTPFAGYLVGASGESPSLTRRALVDMRDATTR